MRTTIASATFLLLGAGAVTIGARSNIAHMRGSDTLFDLTAALLKGNVPGIAICPNTTGLNYEGSGSGNGATDMGKGLQELAPMSSFLSGAQACGGIPAGATAPAITDTALPQLGQAAEGMVLALDAVNIVANGTTGGAAACSGVAFSNAGGASLTLGGADGACDTSGCVGNVYTPTSETDYLRVLYFGIAGGNVATRNCNSNVRRKLISSYKNLFQTQGAACTTGTCANKPLRHAYRRDDASGTTDVFFAAIGVNSAFSGYNKKTYRSGGLQQSNPFCNAGDVGADHSNGINLGFDDSLTPVAGPNWNTKIGESDFADLDPVRVPCVDGGDDVCSANNMRRCAGGSLAGATCQHNSDCPGGGTCSANAPGYISTLQCIHAGKATGTFCTDDSDCAAGDFCSGTNGLVQAIFVPSQNLVDVNYPVDLCDQGATDVFDTNLPYLSFFGRCGDGSDAFGNGCPIQGKVCGDGVGNHPTPCHVPGQPNKTSGTSYLCVQQSFLGQQAICFASSPNNGTECRGANNWMRDVAGTLLNDSSIDPTVPRQFLGAFFRRHSNSMGEGGTCLCKENDATAQIGCLAGCGEACSVGFGGGGAIAPVGKGTALAVRGVLPTKTTVQALLSTDGDTFFNRYRLSRKLFYNTIVGYGEPTFNATGDGTGAGVSGEELNLVKCAVNPALQTQYETKLGFFALPNNAPFCQDFPEFKTCSGGLHPGDPCTQNSDCPGLASQNVAAGTCSATPTCNNAGNVAASNTNACANNGNAGLPL